MKKILYITASIFFISIFIFSCKKDEEKIPPSINFKTSANYTQNNGVVEVGGVLYFGIQARGNSTEITNFTIKKVLENGSVITVMDTALYSMNLDLNKICYQNVEDKVTWTFSVMDRNHLSSEISMVVYKDQNSTFGGIFYYPSIKLGYQNNTQYGHFLDPYTGTVYFEDSATTNQSKIDVLCYYIVSNNLPSPVLSSPGEMDNFSTEAQTYYPYIANWTTRKYTLWDISVDDSPISESAFDAAQNDSLLIVSYNDVWGKKKFKWATSGKIIPFITSAGKKGLVKVKNADNTDNGTIEIAIKIQQ
ncbi:MAG: hypothetical protein HGB12_06580 [Bacteroidetes bacterium]|nr:hypothetical protein [Bacteroidota bacterium]